MLDFYVDDYYATFYDDMKEEKEEKKDIMMLPEDVMKQSEDPMWTSTNRTMRQSSSSAEGISLSLFTQRVNK